MLKISFGEFSESQHLTLAETEKWVQPGTALLQSIAALSRYTAEPHPKTTLELRPLTSFNTKVLFLERPPTGHKSTLLQAWWSLVTGSDSLKYRFFCQESMVFQDRWSLEAMVSQYFTDCIVSD